MAAPNSNVDQALVASVWKYLTTDLVDNIFHVQKLIGAYKSKGMVVEADGGERLVIPIKYANNPSVQAMSAWDEVDISETDEMTRAEYNWAVYGGSLALADLDIARNSGDSKRIDLVDAKLDILKRSFQKVLNDDLFTGNANDARKILGLTQLVAATGTIGNINSSSFTWWQSYVDSSAEALDPADMETAFNTASDNSQPPNLIVTTQTLYEKYIALAYSKETLYKPDAKMAELGFDGATYKGVPLIWDSAAPAGYMFFLNSDYVQFRPHRDFNFKVLEQERLPKQFVNSWLIELICAHTISARKFNARLQAKTA